MMFSRLRLGILIFLLVKWVGLAHATETKSRYNEAPSLSHAIEILEGTPTGKHALEQARALHIPIREGRISKTEITVTRTFDGTREKMSFSTQVLVAKEKDPVFQALDLAHELVHAVNPKHNPFDPKLNPDEYVKAGIEGQGGEAQAIAQECKVGKELTSIKADDVQLIKARCQYVWKLEKNEQKWKQSFYFLGQHYHNFLTLMNGFKRPSAVIWNEKVEERTPMFASAVAHKPYPLALLEEYISITKTICEKSMKTEVGRRLASLTALERRCRALSPEDSDSD